MSLNIYTRLSDNDEKRIIPLLKGRTAYAYALDAIREKMSREERGEVA